jgi:hypothetical protein
VRAGVPVGMQNYQFKAQAVSRKRGIEKLTTIGKTEFDLVCILLPYII